ncbi:MAG: OmpH family outer membrane protein, partial [Gemmatimonadota bacterium]|nr:OmpH family outer membrane protein [Gemmatimonadota bacterium]
MTRVLTGIFAGVIGATLLAVAPATAQNARVGYINVQRVLAEAPGTADAQQTFDREMQGFRAELEAMENELDTLQANFERQQATMTESMRQQQQSTMQQKFITYQQRQSD